MSSAVALNSLKGSSIPEEEQLVRVGPCDPTLKEMKTLL